MARPMRIEFAEAVFRDDGNWRQFLAKPGQVCRSKTAHTMKIAQYVGPLCDPFAGNAHKTKIAKCV